MAGITSQTGVYPLDTIRTRMTTTPGVYSCVLGHPAKQFRQEDDCCRTFRRAVYHPAWKSNKESPNRKPKAIRAIARHALAFTSHRPPRACQSDWNVGHPSVSSPVSVSWSLSQPPFFVCASNSVYSVQILYILFKCTVAVCVLGRGLFDGIKTVCKTEGWPALFNGLFPANVFAVPYYGTQFFTYDMLRVRTSPAAVANRPLHKRARGACTLTTCQ